MTTSDSAAPRRAVPPAGGRDVFIREMAYAFYEARGCVDGHDLEDWLNAEAQFDRGPAEPDDTVDRAPGAANH